MSKSAVRTKVRSRRIIRHGCEAEADTIYEENKRTIDALNATTASVLKKALKAAAGEIPQGPVYANLTLDVDKSNLPDAAVTVQIPSAQKASDVEADAKFSKLVEVITTALGVSKDALEPTVTDSAGGDIIIIRLVLRKPVACSVHRACQEDM